MKRSPSWKSSNSSAGLNIPHILRKRFFITVFTRARNFSVSWAKSIQLTPPSCSFQIPLIVISHLLLGLPIGLLSGLPTRTLYAPLLPPYVLRGPLISVLIWSPEYYFCEVYRSYISSLFPLLHFPVNLYLIGPIIFLCTLYWNTDRLSYSLTFRSLTTYIYIYIYIYMSYRSANIQTLHFKYLFNKYTCWIF